jgi:hypothetical protein
MAALPAGGTVLATHAKTRRLAQPAPGTREEIREEIPLRDRLLLKRRIALITQDHAGLLAE